MTPPSADMIITAFPKPKQHPLVEQNGLRWAHSYSERHWLNRQEQNGETSAGPPSSYPTQLLCVRQASLFFVFVFVCSSISSHVLSFSSPTIATDIHTTGTTVHLTLLTFYPFNSPHPHQHLHQLESKMTKKRARPVYYHLHYPDELGKAAHDSLRNNQVCVDRHDTFWPHPRVLASTIYIHSHCTNQVFLRVHVAH